MRAINSTSRAAIAAAIALMVTLAGILTACSSGANESGASQVGSTGAMGTPLASVASHPVKSVVVDNGTAIAVTEAGELWVWGNNDNGQLGNGSTSNSSTPTMLMNDVASASVAFDRVAALKNDGSLWMWGNDRLGEVGCGQSGNATNDAGDLIQTEPTCVLEGVTRFDLGASTTGAVKDDGTLWMWGSASRVGNGGVGNDSYYSELSKEDMAIQTVPVKVLDGARDVVSGGDRIGAILTDGSLMMWGDNGMGALGIEGMEPAEDGYGSVHASSDVPVKILDDVVSVDFEMYGSAALTGNGELYAWGWNDGAMGAVTKDQYGNREDIIETPKLIAEDVQDFSFKYDGANGFAILKNDNSLWMCGSNSYGEAGVGHDDTVTSPVKVLDSVVKFVEGNDHTAAIKDDGTLWMWGCADYGFPSNISSNGTATYGSAMCTIPTQVLENVAEVRLADSYPYCRVAVIKTDGSMWTWGANGGSDQEEKDPVKVSDNVKAIEFFTFFNTAVITDSGELLMWGDNSNGQLGSDVGTSSKTPVSPLE